MPAEHPQRSRLYIHLEPSEEESLSLDIPHLLHLPPTPDLRHTASLASFAPSTYSGHSFRGVPHLAILKAPLSPASSACSSPIEEEDFHAHGAFSPTYSASSALRCFLPAGATVKSRKRTLSRLRCQSLDDTSDESSAGPSTPTSPQSTNFVIPAISRTSSSYSSALEQEPSLLPSAIRRAVPRRPRQTETCLSSPSSSYRPPVVHRRNQSHDGTITVSPTLRNYVPVIKVPRPGSPKRTRIAQSPHTSVHSEIVNQLDPALAAAERASRFRVQSCCSACGQRGFDYPRCGKCGVSWCSRECRLPNGIKRHAC